MAKFVLAMDAGTTSNRAILFDERCEIVSMEQQEFTQYFPQPGLVEHDAEEIWETMLFVAKRAIEKGNASAKDIACIGITNQRETAVVWEKATGKPLGHAIVWQDRRTADYCDQLIEAGETAFFKDRTGLIIDPYFSATKIKWILEHNPGAYERAARGELLFGTVETWLIWKLSGGKIHVTDYSNASRTMLYNIFELKWDKEILDKFGIPEAMLPEVKESSFVYGNTDKHIFGEAIPISGAAGDQQSALFGQTCFNRGDAKNTYGTGCFLLMNTGETPVRSDTGLVTTIAWGEGGRVEYALEGSVFVAGSAIQWLRDELRIIPSAPASEEIARSVPDTNGCYVVPAFTGLAAPHWDPYARGAVLGLTRGVNREHLVRATVESLAYQSYDVLRAMEEDLQAPLGTIRVDGGASANDFLMQFQADLMNEVIDRPACVETTAMGAAFLAGLAVGFFKSKEELIRYRRSGAVFRPHMAQEERTRKIHMWHKAVDCVKGWAREGE